MPLMIRILVGQTKADRVSYDDGSPHVCPICLDPQPASPISYDQWRMWPCLVAQSSTYSDKSKKEKI